jgi:hypothetical protein
MATYPRRTFTGMRGGEQASGRPMRDPRHHEFFERRVHTRGTMPFPLHRGQVIASRPMQLAQT